MPIGRTRGTLTICGVGLMLVADLGLAQCSLEDLNASWSRASTAIRDWESRKQIKVIDAVKVGLMADFCDSARAFSVEKNVPLSAIEEKSAQVLDRYLERVVDARQSQATFGALLRGAFGMPGFAQPKIKKYGLLKITYSITVDTLIVNRDKFLPIPVLLVPIGKLAVEGTAKGKHACGAEVEVLPAVESTFDCR